MYDYRIKNTLKYVRQLKRDLIYFRRHASHQVIGLALYSIQVLMKCPPQEDKLCPFNFAVSTVLGYIS